MKVFINSDFAVFAKLGQPVLNPTFIDSSPFYTRVACVFFKNALHLFRKIAENQIVNMRVQCSPFTHFILPPKVTLFAYTILLFICGPQCLPAQVKVSPEIGGSYAPYTIYGINTQHTSNRLDYLFGINGSLQISKHFLANLRISYVDREDFKWQDLVLRPKYLYSTYTQSDLNMELSLLYTISEAFDAGAGYTLVRRIKSEYFINDVDEDFLWQYNNWNGGFHAMIVFHYRRFYARLTYARRFQPYDLVFLFSEGQDRFDLTVGYELFGGSAGGK